MSRKGFYNPRYILYVLVAMIAAGAFSIVVNAQKPKNKQKEETYTRPAPTKPIEPTIPEANRYQDDKVFLENADSLFRPRNEFEEFQIVKGTVKFRQGGMWMFCDSAYYYPEKNSMDAFGHVEMRQGDTLFVYSDKLYYDGVSKHATLTRGPSRGDVTLKDPKVTLTTDSLDYDIGSEIGWYTTGGRLQDDLNTLTSIYGEYSPQTKLAKFRDDVLLVNGKDGYKMYTEELDYSTETHIADINTQTRIEGANDTIITTRGWYDTRHDHAQLTERSTIIHSDSTAKITTLEGDSIIYDKETRISRAYMFRDPSKRQRPMVITDTARKVILVGGYGEYNDSTRLAFSTDYPMLMEFSRPDTLFLRADTILSFITTEMVWPDSLARGLKPEIRARLRQFDNIVDLAADVLPLKLELLPPGFPEAGAWLKEKREAERKAREAEEKAKAEAKAREAELAQANELESDEGSSGDEGNEKPEPLPMEAVTENEAAAEDTVPKLRIDALGRDSAFMVPKEFHTARAIGRARFFNKDMQGLADTLIFREKDSILNMLRKPIVWTGERQVYGNLINVHFNDSTADWAELPQAGMVAEHIDEDFYDQMTGSHIKAYLEGETLKRLEVDGNVQTIFLPQEEDSTYNKLVTAESSYLTIDMDGNDMKRLKMWPEVTGTVTPLFQVKKSQQYIEGFRWLEGIRPKRAWYGDRVVWEDDLGEVPDEVDRYFKEPPLIKAPAKSPDVKGKPTSRPSSAPQDFKSTI